jgi:hypothetical protein
MSIIAMNTDNPLGQRPFRQMGLAGDYDFPNAPLPWRVPPELLAGNAAKQQEIHPPATVYEQASPWDAEESTMMLGALAVTSTQTVVPTANTTPTTTSAVASGAPSWSSYLTEQSIIPGISNFDVGVGVIALFALLKALK